MIHASPQRFPAQLSDARRGAIPWSVLIFLLGFFLLLIVVSKMFLIPALQAAQGATDAERQRLSAYSALVLAVVLFCLCVGLLMTFRIGKFFFPRPGGPRVKTQYIDAWAEAGKRMSPPDEKRK